MVISRNQLHLIMFIVMLGQSHVAFAASPSCPASIQVSGFPLAAPWVQSDNENSGLTVSQPKQDIWLQKGREYYRCVYIDPSQPNRNDRIIYVSRQIPVNLSTMEKMQYFKTTSCPSDSIHIDVGINTPSPWLKSNFTYSNTIRYMTITGQAITAAEQQYADANNIDIYKGQADNQMFCGYTWGFPVGTSVKKLAITRPIEANVLPGSFASTPSSLSANGLKAPTALPGQPQSTPMNKNEMVKAKIKTPVLPTAPNKPANNLIGHELSHTVSNSQPGHRTIKPVKISIRLGSTCRPKTFPEHAEILHAGNKREVECVNGKVRLKQDRRLKFKSPTGPVLKKEKDKGFTDEMPDDLPAG